MAADRDTALFTGAVWKAGYVELSGTVTFSDALLAILIPAVSTSISQECGRKFTRETHTRWLDGSGTESLYLPHWPIVMSGVTGAGIWVSTVELDQRANGEDGDYIVLGDEVGSSASVGEESAWGEVVRISGTWPRDRRNIKAVYAGGYATIPDDIVLTAMEWTAVEFQKATKQQFTATSETAAPGGSVSVAPLQMPLSVRQRLAKWKRNGNW